MSHPKQACRVPQGLPVLTLVGLALASYMMILIRKHAFLAWDDLWLTQQNLYIRYPNWHNLRAIWSISESRFQMGAEYLPVREMSYLIDHLFWRLNPLGFHLQNILIHGANTLLVYLVILRIFHKHDRPLAWSAAAIFAVHPIHVEAVAWIASRKDLLCTFFFLAAIYCWFCLWQIRIRTLQMLVYLLLLVSGMCAMLSKSTAVTLPAALILTHIMFHGRDVRKFAYSIPVWVYACIFTRIHWQVAKDVGLANAPLTGGDPLSHILSNLHALADRLWKTLLPCALQPSVKFPVVTSLWTWQGLTGALLVLLACHGLVQFVRRITRQSRRHFHASVTAWAVLWYWITMLPVSNIIPKTTISLLADRYLYLSTIPVFVLIAAVPRLTKRRRLKHIAVTAVLMILFTLTQLYTLAWKNDKTLCQHILKLDPRNTFARIYLASHYLKNFQARRALSSLAPLKAQYHNLNNTEQESYHFKTALAHLGLGQRDLAMANLHQALARNPHNRDVLLSLGEIYMQENKLDLAERYLNQVIPNNPMYYQTLRVSSDLYIRQQKWRQAYKSLKFYLAIKAEDAWAYCKLGKAAIQLDRLQEADRALALATIYNRRTLTEINHAISNEYVELGKKLESKGKTAGAIRAYQQSCVLNAKNHVPVYNLGVLYYAQGDLQQASTCFDKAVHLAPDMVDAYFNRAVVAYKLGEILKAIDDFQTVTRLQPQDAMGFYFLGKCLAQTGQQEQAKDAWMLGLRYNPKNPNLQQALATPMPDDKPH